MVCNKIGFIGAGSMAQTMIKGLTERKVVKNHNIWVTNRENRDRLFELRKKYRVNCTMDKKKVLDNTDTIVIAVKPAGVPQVLQDIEPFINEKQLIISVAAGITTQMIETILNKEIPVVRVMPNTSCAIGESATAIAKGKFANRQHLETASKLFKSLGEVVIVDEKDMDLITGLSGSGPAYFYYMIELMEKTATSFGLPKETARKLLLQTLYGAAKMLRDLNEEPSTLRQKVTSPEGTTHAALEVFQNMNLEETVRKAIIKAASRSRELGMQKVR